MSKGSWPLEGQIETGQVRLGQAKVGWKYVCSIFEKISLIPRVSLIVVTSLINQLLMNSL